MEQVLKKRYEHIINSKYKITKMDVMKNPCNNMIEPVFYFYPNQDFITNAKFNKNRIWVTITGTGIYNTTIPVLAVIDEVYHNCQPNFSVCHREYAIILRDTSFIGYPKNLGHFKSPVPMHITIFCTH